MFNTIIELADKFYKMAQRYGKSLKEIIYKKYIPKITQLISMYDKEAEGRTDYQIYIEYVIAASYGPDSKSFVIEKTLDWETRNYVDVKMPTSYGPINSYIIIKIFKKYKNYQSDNENITNKIQGLEPIKKEILNFIISELNKNISPEAIKTPFSDFFTMDAYVEK